MIVNGTNLIALSKGLSKIFDDTYRNLIKDVDYAKIATTIRAGNNTTIDYGWLGDFPKMREWIGDRVIRDLAAHKYSISKKDYEVTIGVSRDDIEFDRLGIVKPRVTSLAEGAVTHYDELVFPLLETNGVCFDGKTFFATDHDIGGSEFSNKGTKVLNRDSFLEYRAEMRGIVSDTGKPLRIKPDILVVPPELEQVAIEILIQDRLANGASNPTKGLAGYMVCDYLTSATGWYLLDTRSVLKPFILQITKDMKFQAMNKPDDESVFMRKEFRYGVDSMDNVGYGLWQLAFSSDGTV